MTERHEAAGAELKYQARDDAVPRHNTTLAVLFGAVAALCAAVIVGATFVEEARVRQWRGVQVAALWACLLLATCLAPAGLVLGIRGLRRRASRTLPLWVALLLSGAGLLLLVYFVIHVN